jgi:hypothetical protein
VVQVQVQVQLKNCRIAELQRCELKRCRVQMSQGSADEQICIGGCAEVKMCRCANMQRCRCAEVQRCKHAEMQTCKHAEVQTCSLQNWNPDSAKMNF